MLRRLVALTAISFALLSCVLAAPEAEARRQSYSSTHSSRRHSGSTISSHSSRHHGRHHARRHTRPAPKAAAKPKYAYPLELFYMSPPEFDQTPFPAETAKKIRYDFEHGLADKYKANDLVRAGVVLYHPLRGGIFTRREPVKYIIVHSTETGPPVSAISVIDAWSSLGRRHAGAQYVVERNGRIYQACEPDMATVHVNIFKTLPGINNDNSIGIEMNHTGKQSYPREQREAVKRLVTYLQDRYHVVNENVITHRYAQQGDHTDPVAFDFEAFLATKDEFRNRALAMKKDLAPAVQTAATPAAIPPVAPEVTVVTTTVEASTVVPEDSMLPKDTLAMPPRAPNVVKEVGQVVGAPLPGPPVLRKEMELNPGDAAALEAERKEEQILENELEPMQNVP